MIKMKLMTVRSAQRGWLCQLRVDGPLSFQTVGLALFLCYTVMFVEHSSTKLQYRFGSPSTILTNAHWYIKALRGFCQLVKELSKRVKLTMRSLVCSHSMDVNVRLEHLKNMCKGTRTMCISFAQYLAGRVESDWNNNTVLCVLYHIPPLRVRKMLAVPCE